MSDSRVDLTSSQHGTVYWITGLSGSGKTTLGLRLRDALKARGKAVTLVDGDEVRELLMDSSGYDREGRRTVAMFIGRLCRFVALQGIDVVCPTISMFDACRDWNRANMTQYVEIYLHVPIAELIRRDPKQIYARAQRGELSNVVGIDITPEEPKQPDLLFSFDEGKTMDQILSSILAFRTPTAND